MICCIIKQGIDETMVELMYKQCCIPGGSVNPITHDSEWFFGLSFQLAMNSIIIVSVSKTDDYMKLFARLRSVKSIIPVLMEHWHDVCLKVLNTLSVEWTMLFEKLVKACVAIEFIQQRNKLIKIHILPTIIQLSPVSNQHNFSLCYLKVHRHIHHFFISNTILWTYFLIIWNNRMLLVGLKPLFCIFRVLSCHVFAVFLKSCRTRENTHQFNSLRYFYSDLRLTHHRNECQ